MVKIFSEDDHAALQDAVHEAEQQTAAEIAIVVARASDGYSVIALAFGIVLGGLITLGLWHEAVLTDFPQLLLLQLLVCALVLVIPPLRHLALHLVPRRYMLHRAAQRAASEYVHLTHRLPAAAPVLLLYISLAERYVHIYASRFVRERIPDREWENIVATLTDSAKEDGVCTAAVAALGEAAKMLKAVFPATGRVRNLANVMEVID